MTAKTIRPLIVKHASRASALMTDESNLYTKLGREFASHHSVDHSRDEYAYYDKGTDRVVSINVSETAGSATRLANGRYWSAGPLPARSAVTVSLWPEALRLTIMAQIVPQEARDGDPLGSRQAPRRRLRWRHQAVSDADGRGSQGRQFQRAIRGRAWTVSGGP